MSDLGLIQLEKVSYDLMQLGRNSHLRMFVSTGKLMNNGKPNQILRGSKYNSTKYGQMGQSQAASYDIKASMFITIDHYNYDTKIRENVLFSEPHLPLLKEWAVNTYNTINNDYQQIWVESNQTGSVTLNPTYQTVFTTPALIAGKTFSLVPSVVQIQTANNGINNERGFTLLINGNACYEELKLSQVVKLLEEINNINFREDKFKMVNFYIQSLNNLRLTAICGQLGITNNVQQSQFQSQTNFGQQQQQTNFGQQQQSNLGQNHLGNFKSMGQNQNNNPAPNTNQSQVNKPEVSSHFGKINKEETVDPNLKQDAKIETMDSISDVSKAINSSLGKLDLNTIQKDSENSELPKTNENFGRDETTGNGLADKLSSVDVTELDDDDLI